VARFRVAFDGAWQGDFDILTDAVEWAQDVSATTGRETWVVERRFLGFSERLRASFPEERRERAEELWRAAKTASWFGGGGSVP
jgi:hypothetical protein